VCHEIIDTVPSIQNILLRKITLELLKKYGASERYQAEAKLYPDLCLARVLSQYNDLYKIVTETGETLAEISGKFRYNATCLSEYPAVGDFAMVDRSEVSSGHAIIHHLLTRKSVFERPAVGTENEMQVVAANIDIIFICMSLNKDYNLSRLERYLSVAWNSQAVPVIVLTKSDLCDDLPAVINEITAIAMGTDIIVTSNLDQVSCDRLLSYLKPEMTASFIGSSGVGKSTLINKLARQELLATSAIGLDDKGRHTTSRRELFILPQGGLVIDTPGMRELGADSANISKSFADIDALVVQCRFTDCTHTNEPGCAIIQALEEGVLEERRFKNYQKLKIEAKYDGLSPRQIENEKINAMFGSKGELKRARDYFKKKNNRGY